jgi:hypothetical protein
VSLFTLGSFVIASIGQKIKRRFEVIYEMIFSKNGLGYILGDFSKTHLVTLFPT